MGSYEKSAKTPAKGVVYSEIKHKQKFVNIKANLGEKNAKLLNESHFMAKEQQLEEMVTKYTNHDNKSPSEEHDLAIFNDQ